MNNTYDPSKIMLVNNTGANVGDFIKDAVFACIRNNEPLPEAIADLFTLEIKVINGQTRGILEFA